MSEYIVEKKHVQRFLAKNLSPLLRKSSMPQWKVAQEMNMSHTTLNDWSSGLRAPLVPNSLLRLYSIASATEADYAAVQKIIRVSDEELHAIRVNNRPPGQILSLGALRDKTKRRKLRKIGGAVADLHYRNYIKPPYFKKWPGYS